MPADKNGKYSRVVASKETNHDNGNYNKTDAAVPAAAKNLPSASTPMGPKNGPAIENRAYVANSSTNIPRSANEEKYAMVTPGQPSLPQGVTEGSGSKTTAGDPSFSPMSSANKPDPEKGIVVKSK